jgi:hypothetical protein
MNVFHHSLGSTLSAPAASASSGVFGFMEPGYDPAAILASRVAEAVAVLSLAGFLVAKFATARR